MKKNLLTVFFAIFALYAYSASNFGKDYFAIGEYAKAKEYFESTLATSAAESNYYLGEIAFAEGKPDVALTYYEKGLNADPAYVFNKIGKAKVMLKSKPADAELIFASVLKKLKKDPQVNVLIARAYFDNGLKVQAATKLVAARKVAKKSASLYILEGDILLSESKLNEALGVFEQATYFEPNNFEAIVKVSRNYIKTKQQSSVGLAIEKLTPLLTIYPDYTIVNRELGIAYNTVGKYKLAIESFVKYYGEGQCDFGDITYLASAYYFTDQFEKSKILLDQGLAKDSNNFVFNRFKMYNAAKLKDVQNGMAIASKFFSLKDEFIDKDYSTYAQILVDAGNFEESLKAFDKVIGLNPNKPDTYKDLASLYSKMNESLKSAQSYEKFIVLKDSLGQDVEGSDYYLMGREWYKIGQTTFKKDTTPQGRLLAKEYLVKADTAFGVVCILNLESYLGYLWRGHANAAMEPDTIVGLARPHYDKALAMMLKRIEGGQPLATYRKDILNIHQYEAVFAYQRQDKQNALLYSNKMLELDPANATAKSIIEFFNPTPQVNASGATKATAKPTAPKTAVDAKK